MKKTDQDKELSPALKIYALYPRKVARGNALKAIEKALATTTEEELAEATAAFAAATAKWPDDERIYIPHPATWFNRESYADDRAEWERKSPVAPTPKFMHMGAPAPKQYKIKL